MRKLGLIVEGQGDEAALPVLVQRYISEFSPAPISTSRPFRVRRGKFASKFDDYERALELLAHSCHQIIVVLDADGECPVTLANDLTERARSCAGHVDVRVVVADSEYESWFVASAKTIHGYRGIDGNAISVDNSDLIRSPKATLKNALSAGTYSETVDQPALSRLIDFNEASSNSRSFRRLLSVFRELLGEG